VIIRRSEHRLYHFRDRLSRPRAITFLCYRYSMPTIVNLPPEVLRSIFSYIEFQDELAALSLRCKEFRHPAQQCLFKSFSHGWQNGPRSRYTEDLALFKFRRLQSFCLSVFRRPDLGLEVRDIELAEVYHGTSPVIKTDSVLSSAIRMIDLFRAVPRRASNTYDEDALQGFLLTRLRNAESIRISGNKTTPYLTMALYEIFRSPATATPHLKDISLISWQPSEALPGVYLDWDHSGDSPLTPLQDRTRSRSGLFDPLRFSFPTIYGRNIRSISNKNRGSIELTMIGVMLSKSSLVQLHEPDCLQSLIIDWRGPGPRRIGWDAEDLIHSLRVQTRSLRRLVILHPQVPLQWSRRVQYANENVFDHEYAYSSDSHRQTPSEDFQESESSWDKTELRTMCLDDDYSHSNDYDTSSSNHAPPPPQLNLSILHRLEQLTIEADMLFGPLPANPQIRLDRLLPRSLRSLEIVAFHPSHTLPIIKVLRSAYGAVPRLRKITLVAPSKFEILQLIWDMSRSPLLILQIFIGPSIATARCWNPSSDPWVPTRPLINPKVPHHWDSHALTGISNDDTWVSVSWKWQLGRRIRPGELNICWQYDVDRGCSCSQRGEHWIGVWPFEIPDEMYDQSSAEAESESESIDDGFG
jgi:hypothetical protein